VLLSPHLPDESLCGSCAMRNDGKMSICSITTTAVSPNEPFALRLGKADKAIRFPKLTICDPCKRLFGVLGRVIGETVEGLPARIYKAFSEHLINPLLSVFENTGSIASLVAGYCDSLGPCAGLDDPWNCEGFLTKKYEDDLRGMGCTTSFNQAALTTPQLAQMAFDHMAITCLFPPDRALKPVEPCMHMCFQPLVEYKHGDSVLTQHCAREWATLKVSDWPSTASLPKCPCKTQPCLGDAAIFDLRSPSIPGVRSTTGLLAHTGIESAIWRNYRPALMDAGATFQVLTSLVVRVIVRTWARAYSKFVFIERIALEVPDFTEERLECRCYSPDIVYSKKSKKSNRAASAFIDEVRGFPLV